MVQVKVEELICFRCGHSWLPRQKNVSLCPNCKSHLWYDKPLQRERIVMRLDRRLDKAIRSGDKAKAESIKERIKKIKRFPYQKAR